MTKSNSVSCINRRQFLGTSGVATATTLATPVSFAGAAAAESSGGAGPNAAITKKSLPIGVFSPVYRHLSLDEMLDKISSLGLEAVEIGAGGYSATPQCPLDELVSDPMKARAWKKKFDDRGIRMMALSCHSNAIHPNATKAADDARAFRQTILLSEILEVPTVVGFSGCPGGSPADVTPTWITYDWPTDHARALAWQWKERVIPYWMETVKFARQHGVRRIALEMHPNFVVYNPRTLMRLRETVGEEIGTNCDLSHLFWQGCDAIDVIHFLGKQGAIYHAHMKDTAFNSINVRRYGVLNFASSKKDLPDASDSFRAVGYGHSADLWKDVIAAYADVGYDGMLSIENEDPILSGEDGVKRAAYVLKNVRAELLAGN
ncbi:MAG: sugar phosphate isomerase/epimerase family protein [Bryobacteraceae bacterium]